MGISNSGNRKRTHNPRHRATENPTGFTRTSAAVLRTYEDLLNADSRWALSEGSRHFEGSSAVFTTLHSICRRLKDLGVPYAVVGGMAISARRASFH